MPPIVSIIMPVHNGAEHLSQTIESLLAQSFDDFELCIVDDASTDTSTEILAHYAAADERVGVLRNAANLGVSESANRAIAATSGTYIARSDHDDVSVPERLTLQVALLDSSPHIGLVGGAIRVVDGAGVALETRYPPTDHASIRLALLFNSAFYHSTVMLRRAALDDSGLGYRSEFECTDDYDLWTRLAVTTEAANLSEILIDYRVHDTQISTQKAAQQRDEADRISVAAVLEVFVAAGGLPPTAIETTRFRHLLEFGAADPMLDAADALAFLDRAVGALAAAPDLDGALLTKAAIAARHRLLGGLGSTELARLMVRRESPPATARRELLAELRRRGRNRWRRRR